MKKIFMVIALMAMLMLPFTSFSMTALEDGDLSSVTGQAGVSINLDATVNLTADVVAWGDADGITSGTYTDNPGWVGLTDLNVANLRVRADQTLLEGEYFLKHNGVALAAALQTEAATFIPAYNATFGPCADVACIMADAANAATVAGWDTFSAAVAAFAPVSAYAASATTLQAEIAAGDFTPFAPLTIDVATGTGVVGDHGDGVTFVRIGLGSLQIAMDSMNADVKLGPDDSVTAGVPELKYTLGSLYLEDLFLRVGGNSYVDIFNARGAGKQGVSIYVDATIKDLSIGTLAWGDADGIDWGFRNIAGDTPGTVKLHTDAEGLETPDAQTTDKFVPTIGGAGWIGLNDLEIAKIEVAGQVGIDVGTNAGVTAVNITLGVAGTPFNAVVSGIDGTVALGAAKTSLNQELGELYVGALDIDISGSLALGARGTTQGVTIDLSGLTVAIGSFDVSWGDLDGYTGAANAGYVGLKDLTISGLVLGGSVTIDVATVGTDVTTYTATSVTDMMYAGYVENNLSPTFVHIGLNNVGVTIGTLSAGVAFDSAKDLSSANNLMGSLYVDNMVVGINGWVDIGAH
ncbi:MAG: hypothetical protein PHD57_13375, partial [Desulfobacterales bacterium]|nr:hypothetical protein [Desulfobacterales bacterium]